MGDTFNGNWYGGNENRGYPIDDSATGVDDAGGFVPHDIIVDARVIVPAAVAAGVFVGAIAAGPNVATVVLMADDVDFTPLGAVTVPAPIVPYKSYAIRPMQPGVAGWVVFGNGALQPYVGRFSSAGQSRLATRCARPYRPFPVPSIGKEFLSTTLTGVVSLVAGEDISITVEDRTIGDSPVRAVVVGLANTLNRDVYALYTGPCDGRPESGSCAKTPLQSINGVSPDCDGNIDIDFRGVAASATPGGGGVTLSLPIGLSSTCGDDGLPAGDGTLANDYPDRCASIGSLNSSHGG